LRGDLDIVVTSAPNVVNPRLGDMAPKNPKAVAADPKSLVDPSFIYELETAGTIKQLLRRWQGINPAAVPVNAVLRF
jgi:hypothetical protein